MKKIRNKINTNQLGDENKYKSLIALTRIYNSVNEKGELIHSKLIRRSIKLVHEYNEWIKQIEKGIIRVNFGMFGREIKWYEYRCLGAVGASYLINYIKARSRAVSKTLFIPSYKMLNNKKRRSRV